ncbi:glutamine amidotransferase [Ectothiorhodospira lacustris]|uniref:glutamine amidotransferase n=1 Tax=Ectothiorhodospira lacustris TaxID=2899127 RepID=UPI001EE80C6B|nr:glutamine amidotransferase [Ectothiorhodospira lacustris]MCG5499635.1 glutamine amidotransferase [Ectothiorhodospira lacustris]MCG5509603.1 glutamine amidotransferase [Ectothiorhodospira lacustris]MCG5521602.1 glutamine amidotransferase [Ectothiorhodospira lacustris]
MDTLLIIKTGTKVDSLQDFPGDYEDWIADGMDWPLAQAKVVDVPAGDPLPAPDDITGVVITGSGAMVTEADPWIRQTADWLTQAVSARVPTLGICFGHQILAHALGGRVDWNPRGIEVGTVEIRLRAEAAEDPLFSVLPGRFYGQVSHSQSVLTLPPGAMALGESDMEPHQGFVVNGCAWGLQFHPEFDERITPHYVMHYRDRLAEQGRQIDGLLANVRPTPESSRVLRRFGEWLRSSR